MPLLHPQTLCRERSERRKLQRAIKREERGAARELRRDAGAWMPQLLQCLSCCRMLAHSVLFIKLTPSSLCPSPSPPHSLAAFMAGVRDQERSAKQAELYASEKRAKSFLEQQQADAASGGQGGMWKGGKGKKRT